jgi:hypothetical protein
MARDHEDGVAPARNDAYTGMLSIALLALVGSCVLLYMDYSQYPDSPPALPEKLTPEKPFPKLPAVQPSFKKKEFQVTPTTLELFLGKEGTVTATGGKIAGAEADPKEGLTLDTTEETTIKITAPMAMEGMEQVYMVTVRGPDDKTAKVTVTVKKEMEKEPEKKDMEKKDDNKEKKD